MESARVRIIMCFYVRSKVSPKGDGDFDIAYISRHL
jgi:hypothetical protein